MWIFLSGIVQVSATGPQAVAAELLQFSPQGFPESPVPLTFGRFFGFQRGICVGFVTEDRRRDREAGGFSLGKFRI
jgi:hypothetical protein